MRNFSLALVLGPAAPALRLTPSQHARCAPTTLQMPDLGKMGSGLMDKMGMGNAGLSDDDAKAMETRLKAGEMTFDDFLVQVKVMQKGASMQAMLGKMGGGQMTKEQLDEGQRKMERYGKYVEAMDAEERQDAALLIDETAAARKGASKALTPRLVRIADASGVSVEDVGRFVTEFNMMRGAAVKFANGESPDSIRESMAAEQQQSGAPLNRQQRRMAAKKGKKKKAAGAGGFGRR